MKFRASKPAILLAVLLATALWNPPSSGAVVPEVRGVAAAEQPQKAGNKITYKVTGVERADISYTDGLYETSQVANAQVPWKKSITAKKDANLYQVYAQNKGDGKIVCDIYKGAKRVAHNSSKGEYAVVNCAYQP